MGAHEGSWTVLLLAGLTFKKFSLSGLEIFVLSDILWI